MIVTLVILLASVVAFVCVIAFVSFQVGYTIGHHRRVRNGEEDDASRAR